MRQPLPVPAAAVASGYRPRLLATARPTAFTANGHPHLLSPATVEGHVLSLEVLGYVRLQGAPLLPQAVDGHVLHLEVLAGM
jgi:hypothetical protein